MDNTVVDVSSISQKVTPIDSRADIGGLTVKLIDVTSPGTFTSTVREQLDPTDSPVSDGESMREREVRLFIGYTDDFDDYVQVITTFVSSVNYKDGIYTLKCLDVTRQMRKNIFDFKKTRLAANLTDGTESPLDTELHCNDIDDFKIAQGTSPETYTNIMMTHTAAFSDSPGSTVGYLKVKDSGEIIRYTGVEFGSPYPKFTGVTRGVFGTVAQAVTVDTSEDETEWPEIEEFIYLEQPAPEMVYSILTGIVPGQSPEITYPDHWHLGIPTEYVDLAEFQNIGTDLYDGEEGGFIPRFWHLKKTDGKKFIEKELHMLVGTFSPIHGNGKIGLDRVNTVLQGAPHDTWLSELSIISHSGLNHKPNDVVNSYDIQYEWDGQNFIRSVFFIDGDSAARNGATKTKMLKFKGLHNARHTVAAIANRINVIQDRYRNAPQEIKIKVLPYMDKIQPNDIVKISLDDIQDYAGSGTLARPFEVNQVQTNWLKGDVSLSCFGSSGEAGEPLYTPGTVLDDGFYTTHGTDITTLSPSPDIDGSGNLNSDFHLYGTDDMNNSASIFYYDGDFKISSGVTLYVHDNVRLHALSITVNGTISGVGNGKAGAVSGDTALTPPVELNYPGIEGYIGGTCSSDGVDYYYQGSQWWHPPTYRSRIGASTPGAHSSFPTPSISSGDQTASPIPDVSGIPTDMRGTSGGAGGSALQTKDYEYSSTDRVYSVGGTGGNGGAALCIITRSFSMGINGGIDLSGESGSGGTLTELYPSLDVYPGRGAGGGQGACLIMLDGLNVTYPDLSGKFTATTGSTTPDGNSMDAFSGYYNQVFLGGEPVTGYNEGYEAGNPVNIIDAEDRADVSLKIMYIPD